MCKYAHEVTCVLDSPCLFVQNADSTKTEYRVWNPFRSKIAAAILGGVENIYIVPGSKVLYLGAASGTSVSHVSDLVGPVCSHHMLSLLPCFHCTCARS